MNPTKQNSTEEVASCKGVNENKTLVNQSKSPLVLDKGSLDTNSPLGLISRAITTRTGMDEESAALIALTAVSATIGPSTLLDVPLMGKVNTSLPLLVLNDHPIRMSEVVGSVFGTHKENNYEALFSSGGSSDYSIPQAIHAATVRLDDLSTAEELFRTRGELQLPDTIPLEKFIDDWAVSDCLKSGHPPKNFKKKINACFAKWKNQAEDYLEALDTRVHPTALAEPLHLADYEKRENMFGDGGVFSLDETGIGLLELLAASPAVRRRIGKTWAASFARRPTIVDGQARMSGWLSSFSTAPDRLINQFLNDETLFQSGMTQQTLIIRPGFTGKAAGDILEMIEAADQFGGHLRRCLNFRRRRNLQVIKLGREALGVLEEVRQFYEEAGRKSSGQLPFLQHRISQTTKVALLAHFTGGPTFESELTGRTFRIAHRLVQAAHGQMGRLLDSDWHRDNPQQHLEMELAILLMKVEAKGKSTRRNLVRSYHRKPTATLNILINHALEQGLIREDDGLLFLPGQQ